VPDAPASRPAALARQRGEDHAAFKQSLVDLLFKEIQEPFSAPDPYKVANALIAFFHNEGSRDSGEAVKLAASLRALGVCEAGCEGRCRVCPQEVADKAADTLLSLSVSAARLTEDNKRLRQLVGDIHKELSNGPTMDDDTWRRLAEAVR